MTPKCPYCAGEIESGVKKCRHCGEWLQVRNFRWAFWVVLILAVLLVGGGLTLMTMGNLTYAAKTYGTYGK